MALHVADDVVAAALVGAARVRAAAALRPRVAARRVGRVLRPQVPRQPALVGVALAAELAPERLSVSARVLSVVVVVVVSDAGMLAGRCD